MARESTAPAPAGKLDQSADPIGQLSQWVADALGDVHALGFHNLMLSRCDPRTKKGKTDRLKFEAQARERMEAAYQRRFNGQLQKRSDPKHPELQIVEDVTPAALAAAAQAAIANGVDPSTAWAAVQRAGAVLRRLQDLCVFPSADLPDVVTCHPAHTEAKEAIAELAVMAQARSRPTLSRTMARGECAKLYGVSTRDLLSHLDRLGIYHEHDNRQSIRVDADRIPPQKTR